MISEVKYGMLGTNITILLLTLSISAFRLVFGHGLLCTPRQRGAYISDKCGSNLPIPANPIIDYCAHCLNGGTVATVQQNLPKSGWHLYDPINNFKLSAKRAGLCGDPLGDNDHLIGGQFMPYKKVPIVATYKVGSNIDFEVEIDTNHNGFFEFFLCNLDACQSKDISESCFTKNHCYRLERVPHPACENQNKNTAFDCGPIDESYPGRFYVPCRKTGHVGQHLVGGRSGMMRYALPNGVSCRHCVVQWYWASANSCAPPDFLEYFDTYDNPFGSTCDGDGGAKGGYREGMQTCEGSKTPEEFWSCADIEIKGTQIEPPKDNKPDSNDSQSPSPSVFIGKTQTPSPTASRRPSTPSGNPKVKPAPSPSCIAKGKKCDGSVLCCDIYQVCVYRSKMKKFICQEWWSLHEEASDRRKEVL